MSGGSWEYLCYKDAFELLGRIEDLECMCDRLRREGFADTARHVVSLLECLGKLRGIIENIDEGLNGELSDAFKAIEWFDSGDISKESMVKQIKDYEDEWHVIE